MKAIIKLNRGFTLVELMIAVAISLFVVIGITGTYSTIQATIQASKELENAQEVIRYSSKVFTRSLKQTMQVPDVSVAKQLSVQQDANVTSCIGVAPVAAYQETYTFNALASVLNCRIDDGDDIPILQGITDITYALTANKTLLTIVVQPSVLPDNFGGDVRIDIALTSRILLANM